MQVQTIGTATLYLADSRDALPLLTDIDAVVTDPPYGLSFMGKAWDYDVPSADLWQAVRETMRPGAHLAAFFGSRTYHRGAVAIEDAGLEIRDQMMWLYGTGFPKSGNLKPAHEPIVLARRPLDGSRAANIAQHGVGGLDIERGRVPSEKATGWGGGAAGGQTWTAANCGLAKAGEARPVQGRWPANVLHDGSDAVVDLIGDAARFFYCAKPSKRDRGEGNDHPTVKPTDLMAYLCGLIAPKGGLILDPFMGSGSTGVAAIREGFRFIGIERDPAYFEIACRRLRDG